ncbi:MAG: M3 family oligoendopeptidase, partial [Clostridia bacterium]|nr:M3 family oligoendopeptidase [Clostridia bacterium]
MKFSDIPYSRPDGEAVKAEFAALTEGLRNAKSYEEARAVFLEFEERYAYVNTMDLVSFIRRSMFGDDGFYKEEDDFWWEYEPRLNEYLKDRSQAMLDSPFRREFEAEYGDMMFRIAEFDRSVSSEAIVADKQRENKLIVEYGETLDSVDEVEEFKEDADAGRRYEAFCKDGAAWREKADKLDEIFGELVRLRGGMGKKMGCGFIDLAYRRLYRTFTKEDVKRFREAVVKYVVPVAESVKREQARRIGRPYPMAYSDNEYFFKSGNPHPAGDAEFLVNEGRRFFESLSPEAGGFF